MRKQNSKLKERELQISQLLAQCPTDLVALRKISRCNGSISKFIILIKSYCSFCAGGYLNSNLRTRVWTVLLGINPLEKEDYLRYTTSFNEDNQEEPSKYTQSQQVLRDIERSLHCIDQIQFLSEDERDSKRKILNNIILGILNKRPQLHYYQVCRNAP